MRKYLFHPYGYTLSNHPKTAIPSLGVLIRRKLNPLILSLAARFNQLPLKIVADNRSGTVKESTIYIASHWFPEDVMNAALAIGQPAYILAGNMEVFFHSLEGVATWLYGGIVFDRNDPISRNSAFRKMMRVLELGTGVLLFPEGAWNMSDNALISDLHGGFYELAMQTKCKIVPIVTLPTIENTCVAYIGREIDAEKLCHDAQKEILRYIENCLKKALDLPIPGYPTYSSVMNLIDTGVKTIRSECIHIDCENDVCFEQSLTKISKCAEHVAKRLTEFVTDTDMTEAERSILNRTYACLKAIVNARKRVVITNIRDGMASVKYELMETYGMKRKTTQSMSLKETVKQEKKKLIQSVCYYDPKEEQQAVFTDPLIWFDMQVAEKK